MVKGNAKSQQSRARAKFAESEIEASRLELLHVSKGAAGCGDFPSDDRTEFVARSETVVIQPNGRTTWYFWGAEGDTVALSLRRIQNSGGHFHGRGPVGALSETRFTLGKGYPQNYPVQYVAPEAGGIIELRTEFSSDPKPLIRFHHVQFPGLVQLAAGPGITLVGATASHPLNHFGTSALVSGIRGLANAFHAKYGKNIFVNDMSLIWGGLFDINGTWNGPHQTHREGRTVDINSTSMTQAEKEFFRSTAVSLGFRVVLETSPPHWHLSL